MLFKSTKKILYKDWIWKWLSYKKDYIKESTYGNYSNIIYNHIVPELGDYYIHEINNKILQQFLLNKLKSGRIDKRGGLSQKMVKDIMIIIKSSLRFAVNEGYIQNINFELIYPKSNKREKIYTLTKREQEKLTNYILENKTIKNLGILLTLYSGMRIGEICAMQWKDIDFKHNILHINKTIQRIYVKEKIIESKIVMTTPKTNNAERDIPLNESFAKALKVYKTKEDDYILSCNNKCIEPRTYRRFFQRTLEKAKIKKFNFHSLRHTFATNCINIGVDYKTVSELLGHATVNITLNLYVHPQMSQKKKCINLICKNFETKEIKE